MFLIAKGIEISVFIKQCSIWFSLPTAVKTICDLWKGNEAKLKTAAPMRNSVWKPRILLRASV